ncbi:MAG: rRNA pseudouridine synthase [Alphaproteobacteria bacterium]|nr:rRNA pseudouridine synthase [Alphaproteobacteria bacterium]
MTVRLAKFIADCGVASRRGAESLIEQGAVSVNGKIVDSPVFFVEGNEKICVNGKEIKSKEEIKLYAFHKPINTMTTTKDPMGRKTIYDVLEKKYKNLKYVGRLDFKTTGLLLLTNSGELAREMSLPKNHIQRTYIASVNSFTEKKLDVARKGVCIDGIKYRPMKIEVIDAQTLKVTVEEGKKNEIRIVLRYIGSPVKALHRVEYGPIKLGNLARGKILELDKKTIDLVFEKLLESK